jgi:hypothetical protein
LGFVAPHANERICDCLKCSDGWLFEHCNHLSTNPISDWTRINADKRGVS